MDLATAISTELRTLEPICEFSRHDGYRVYQSERFPAYYSGNGVEIEGLRGRDLDTFERIFDSHFDPGRYAHRTFSFADTPEFENLLADAKGRGYHVTRNVFLIATQADPARVIPEGLTVRPVDTPERWDMMRRFEDTIASAEDWYAGEASSDALFEKNRVISEAIGIQWCYLGPVDRDEMWSKLGVFVHSGVGRLQNVDTAPEHRRKGLATVLVNHAIARTLERGAAGLVVCAEADYHALDLYHKVGFRDLGASMQVMWYEPKNPGD